MTFMVYILILYPPFDYIMLWEDNVSNTEIATYNLISWKRKLICIPHNTAVQMDCVKVTVGDTSPIFFV